MNTATARQPQYPTLLSPITINGITLPNRVIMGSMHLGLEEAPNGFERMAAFYRERARGEVGLIVTGGIAPNWAGRPAEHGAILSHKGEVAQHRLITDAVHAEGGRIVIQLLHFGRYAKHADLVGPSPIASPINPITPHELTDEEVRKTIADFANASKLALEAGYDGVEIMGSEGYLLNEFAAAHANQRDDEWGGDFARRIRFPVEVVKAAKAELGDEAILMYRLSVLDLVPNGATMAETIALARAVEAAGADIINTGIGWHESRVPTIATLVPRAAFAEATERVAQAVSVPVVASNRINDPAVAEQILTDGAAQFVSMARPLLADPEFVSKVRTNQTQRINTCIACNQACIDHTLTGRLTSCLVNPRAANETILLGLPAVRSKKIAVVGAGPAGMAAATNAARRGHTVTLFDEHDVIGGQFDIARRIPGKEEFSQTLRYFGAEIEATGVDLRLGVRVGASDLVGFDEVIVATGITPRIPDIAGIGHRSVVNYLDILRGDVAAGDRVAIIGAGGIGFDVAAFLLYSPDETTDAFFAQWGIDPTYNAPGGLARPRLSPPSRQVSLLQRKSSKPGAGLNPTTGWIHRAELQMKGVDMISGARYDRIDDEGLHITVDGERRVISADTIVICAGQEPNRELVDALHAHGITPHLIGGADVAAELDAKRAIKQATALTDTI